MAQSSWPSPDNSRVVDDLSYEKLVAGQYVDGQLGSPSDTPLVYADSSGRQVFLRSGRYAVLRGHGWTSGATDVTLAVGANTSGSTRIDLVVLGLNRSTWNVTAYVKAGTAGSGVPPALQIDTGSTGIFEIPLAEVTVPNSATVTTAAQIKPRAWWSRPDGYASSGTDTRPPSPATGEAMWESGTKYVWNGTIWERTSNPPAPVQSTQNVTLSGTTGASGIGGDSTWRDFALSVWPVLTFTVPPSGRVYITVSGWIENRNTADSTIWLSYRASGGGMTAGTDGSALNPRALSTHSSRVIASKRSYFSGLTPGATVTLTPVYYSTTASADVNVSSIRYGRLLMEPA